MKKYLILIFLLVVLSAVSLRSMTIRNDILIFNGLDTGPVAKSWFAIHLAGGVIDTSGSCDTLMNWMFGDISNQFGVNSNNSGMYSGFNNYIGDAFNVITGGQKDTIVSGATEVFMGGGYNNYMDAGGDHSGMISGKDNYINSPDCFMGGGEDDTIGINANSSGMVGGELNEIYEQYCFLGGGYNIEIFDNAEFSGCVGSKNGIIQTPYSFGVGWNFNILGGSGNPCNYLFGTGMIDSVSRSVLFGDGAEDTMKTSNTFGVGFWGWFEDSLYVHAGADTTKIFPDGIESHRWYGNLWIMGDTLFFTDGGADTSWIVNNGTVLTIGGDINIELAKQTYFGGNLIGNGGSSNIDWKGYEWNLDIDNNATLAWICFHNEDSIKVDTSTHVMEWTGIGGMHADVMVCVTSDTIASAATLVLTNHNNFVITGGADIDSIDQSCTFPNWAIAYIEFTGTAGFNGIVDGKNLKLAGNFVYSADDMMILQRRGNIFYEMSRSAN